MTPLSPTDRLRIAFDLYEFGESMMRQKLHRDHPTVGAAEIEALLNKWLRDRPFLWLSASEVAQRAARGRRF
jgi:hypothetical protein